MLDFPPVDKSSVFDVIDQLKPMAKTKGTTFASLALTRLLHQQVVA